MDLDVVVYKVLEPVRGTSAKGDWVRHEVVFDQPNDMNRKVCVTFWGDRAQEVPSFREGEPMTLSVNIESREFNGKWYTSLQAWRVTRKGAGAPAGTQAPWAAGMEEIPAGVSGGTAPGRDLPPLGSQREEPVSSSDPADDLPF